MATPAQEACGNAMLRRSTYLLIVAVIGLLTWTAATDLTAKLLILFVPDAYAQITRFTGGSNTLAIILTGAMLVIILPLCGWLSQSVQRWERDTSPERHGYHEITEFQAAWSRFASTFSLLESDRPKQVFSYDHRLTGSGASIDGSALLLSSDIADQLRLGRGRRPTIYDFACFIVLHELGHWRSGDARLAYIRDRMAVTCAVLIGLSIGIGYGSPADPMFLVEVAALTILGSAVILAVLRQMSREIECAADQWALQQLLGVRGPDAAAALVDKLKFEVGRSDAAAPVLAVALGHHPEMARRLDNLRSHPSLWPLVLLWATALASLVWVQAARIDPDCGDCSARYQIWFDSLGWMIVSLLTVLVARLRSPSPDARTVASFSSRVGALLVVCTTYVVARVWVAWETLAAIWRSGEPALAIRWVFLSNDDYTRAIALHLLVAAAILLWPSGNLMKATENLGVPGHLLARRQITRSAIWRECHTIAESFGYGISLCLMIAGVVQMVGPALSGTVHLSSPLWWISMGMSLAMVTIGGYSAFQAPKYREPARWVLGFEAIVLLGALSQMDFVQRLQLAYMTAKNLDPALPETQVMVGALMMKNDAAFWAPDLLEQVWAGWAWDSLMIGVGIACLVVIRLVRRPLAVRHVG